MANRPIRVCYLIDNLAVAGTEKRLVSLLADLDRTKIDPYLCLLDGQRPESMALEPGCCPVLRLGVRSLRHPRALSGAWNFWRFLRRQQIDVLQVCFPDSTYFGAFVGRLARVRKIVGARFNLNYWMTPLHRRLGRLYHRFLLDGTITNCAACRQAVLTDEQAQADSVVVIENGVDLRRFAPAPAPAMRTVRPPRVGVVAALRPVKRLDDFLRAAQLVLAAYPSARFEIAGHGPERARLQQLAIDLGISASVRFLGDVADVPGFLATLDVAVLCSASEGLSNSVLEYMAAGAPIVATDVGGNRELIEHEHNGLLVSAGSPLALADAVQRLLDDEAWAARLGQNARNVAQQRFSWTSMVQRYEDYFLSLAGPQHG